MAAWSLLRRGYQRSWSIGETRHRARWRPLTDEEEATALAELR
jgi:hypothetical protein